VRHAPEVHEGSRRFRHVNSNLPREASRTQFYFMRPSQLATPGSIFSEDAERAAECGMALGAESVLGGSVNGQEAWADPDDLKRCILSWRRLVGWCKFSAQLFAGKPWSW
jgi:hypothetical protein